MRKVKYAKLHDNPFIPGVGNLKDTLPPDNKTLTDFYMEQEPNGALNLYWTVRRGDSTLRRCYQVGAATVRGVLFEDEKVDPKTD